MGRRGSCLLFVGLLAATASAGTGKPPFNVDVSVGWGNCYRPLEWTPIEVVIHPNLKEPFEGELTLEAQQDALTTMRIHRPLTITPGRKERVPLVSKLVFAAEDCRVVIYDRRGRRQWGQRYGMGTFTGGQRRLVAVGHNDLLVGAAGRAEFGLLRVGRNLRCNRETPQGAVQQGAVHVRSKVTEMLPVDWTGYASLDALVLYDVDFSLLNRHQEEAIVEWVRRGGRLLLVLGRNVPPGERPIGKLLPFRPASPQRVRLTSARLTSQWGCRPAGGRGARKLTDIVTIWTIPDPAGPRWRLFEWTGQTAPPATTVPAGFQPDPVRVPAVAYGPAGLGMVGVLACDPGVVGGEQGENLAPFWSDQLNSLFDRRALEVGPPQQVPDEFGMYVTYKAGTPDSAANCVMEHLLTIPELKPLSIWWVIGLLLALAVLIGPLDYLLLKKLGRLPMTWVTSALYLTLFSVGAYYGVHALRAGAAQVRVVSVTDGVAGGGAWRTSYCGIFAPVSDDYRLEGLRPTDQWWSSVAPTEGSELHRFAQRSPSRQVTCVQGDGGSCPVSIPINIWSMQCLVLEAPADGVPFAATAHREGPEVSVRIQNLADVPIRQGWIRGADNRMTEFGSLEPGETRTIAFRPQRAQQARWDTGVPDPDRWEHGRSQQSFSGEATYFAYGCQRRTRAIEGHLRQGALVVCARYHDRRPAGFALAGGKGVYDHVHMARLVVFPQSPGAEPPGEPPPRPVSSGRSRLE